MKQAAKEQKNSEKDLSKMPPQLRPYAYKKGQSGNPSGRPKGAVSMKVYVKTMLEKMSPAEREEFLEGIDKKVIWEMAEGKPKQENELTGSLTIGEVLDAAENGQETA